MRCEGVRADMWGKTDEVWGKTDEVWGIRDEVWGKTDEVWGKTDWLTWWLTRAPTKFIECSIKNRDTPFEQN